jgi:hypothetical protein
MGPLWALPGASVQSDLTPRGEAGWAALRCGSCCSGGLGGVLATLLLGADAGMFHTDWAACPCPQVTMWPSCFTFLWALQSL